MLAAVTPADLGWSPEEAGQLVTKEDLLGLINSILAMRSELKAELAEVKVALAPKEEVARPRRLPDEDPAEFNRVVLAENAALVLSAGQVLTQPEAQLRWFEAALENKALRKHLTEEQVAIYLRMVVLIRQISAAEVYADLYRKLVDAGYDDGDRQLAL